MTLEAAAADVRSAIASAPGTDTRTFARRTRNAVAQAVLAAALARDDVVTPPDLPAPLDEVRVLVGAAVADDLGAVYEGSHGWTSRAIAVLEPLHALASR